MSYVALSQQTNLTREFLAGFLWGDSPEKQARASLRQTLSDIRQSLADRCPDLLTLEGDTVQLGDSSIKIDVLELVELLERGIVPEILMSDPNFTQEILHGFDNLSEDYTTWLLEYRSRFHERLARGLRDRYGSDSLPRGDRRRLADTAILLDPLNEEAYRISMQLAAEDGDVGTALQTYSKLFETLDEKLGMEPSVRTQDLAVKIKTGFFDKVSMSSEVASSATEPSEPKPSATVLNPSVGDAALPTVAVFPFQTLGPDPVPDFFAKGIVEDTVCLLATLREPRVISSNSTRDLDPNNDQCGRVLTNLGANYLVTGTIRKASKNYRLSVQMTDSRSGVVEWARIYTASEADLFDVQVDLAQSIAQRLVPSLQTAELRRARGCHPRDLSAYHLTLVARDLVFRLDRPSFDEAGNLLKLAAEKDPYFAPTFLAMADWYSVRLGQGWSTNPADDRHNLERTAGTAIRLNEESGRALAMLAHNQTILRRKYAEAQEMFERAMEHSPNDAETLMWSSPTLAFVGEPGQAIERAMEAISLSPNDPFLFRYEHFLSIAHYAAKDYAASADWGRKSFERNRHYTSNLRMTAASLAALGKLSEAKDLANRMALLDPDYRVGAFLANHPFRDEGIGRTYAEHLLQAGLPE